MSGKHAGSPSGGWTLSISVVTVVPRELVLGAIARRRPRDRLYLSQYTVQDHLTSIFDKTGVRRRGELVAHLFFNHHSPRQASGIPIAPSGWFDASATRARDWRKPVHARTCGATLTLSPRARA
jgi:hypothetical protein